jgi:CO/xanthine dehydrogenase FAD-binding subunit
MKAITTDFEYLDAKTVEEALDFLSQHKDDEYRIIAGGQSLNTAMKHRLLAPEYIINIKGIPELDYITFRDAFDVDDIFRHPGIGLHHVRRERRPEDWRISHASVS